MELATLDVREITGVANELYQRGLRCYIYQSVSDSFAYSAHLHIGWPVTLRWAPPFPPPSPTPPPSPMMPKVPLLSHDHSPHLHILPSLSPMNISTGGI